MNLVYSMFKRTIIDQDSGLEFLCFEVDSENRSRFGIRNAHGKVLHAFYGTDSFRESSEYEKRILNNCERIVMWKMDLYSISTSIGGGLSEAEVVHLVAMAIPLFDKRPPNKKTLTTFVAF